MLAVGATACSIHLARGAVTLSDKSSTPPEQEGGAPSERRSNQDDVRPEVTGSASAAPETHAEPRERRLGLGGALRFNYNLKSWDEVNLARGGDLVFDTFRLNMDLAFDQLIASAEYRFYGSLGSYLKSGWMGWQFTPDLSVKAGVTQVPFGLLPYASHNWFFNLGYYVGLEDDHDLGLLLHYSPEPWEFHLGYYHSDEGSYFGSSLNSARYSYDLVRVEEVVGDGGAVLREASAQKEQHTLAARVAREFGSASASLTVGASGLFGGIFDESTRRYGTNLSAALFARARFRQFELLLQAAGTRRRPPGGAPQGLWMGAYDSPYRVARDHVLLEGGVAYSIPVDVGLLKSVQIYDDFGALLKDSGTPSFQNVAGVLLSATYVFTYVDFAAGRNQPWLGTEGEGALAEGAPDAPWELRFNINLGLYYEGWLPLPGH